MNDFFPEDSDMAIRLLPLNVGELCAHALELERSCERRFKEYAVRMDELGERPSFLDFATRLDLGDDSDFHAAAPAAELDAARPLSVNQALASLDEADAGGEPSDFGRPLTPPAELDDDFDAPHGDYRNRAVAPGFVPPDAFDQSDVIAVAPALAGGNTVVYRGLIELLERTGA